MAPRAKTQPPTSPRLIRDPELFNGKEPEKYKGWKAIITLALRADQEHFPSPRDKCLFIYGLTEGKVRDRLTPVITNAFTAEEEQAVKQPVKEEQASTILAEDDTLPVQEPWSTQALWQVLDAGRIDPYLARRKRRELRTIKQGNSSLNSFLEKWTKVHEEAEIRDDEEAIETLLTAINPALKRSALPLVIHKDKLSEVIDGLRSTDNYLDNTPAATAPTTDTRPADKFPSAGKPNKQRQWAEKRCFNCNKIGHRAAECRSKKTEMRAARVEELSDEDDEAEVEVTKEVTKNLKG